MLSLLLLGMAYLNSRKKNKKQKTRKTKHTHKNSVRGLWVLHLLVLLILFEAIATRQDLERQETGLGMRRKL